MTVQYPSEENEPKQSTDPTLVRDTVPPQADEWILDQIQAYDVAFVESFKKYRLADANVTVHMRPVHKAFSANEDESVDRRNRRRQVPRVTVDRLDISHAQSRKIAHPVARAFVVDSEQRIGLGAVGPTPVDITYQVDIWAEKREQVNILVFQIMRDYNPLRWVPVVYFAHPQGDYKFKVNTRFFIEGSNDNSDLETEEDVPLIRHTISFRAEAWFWKDLEKFRLIHQVEVACTFEEDPRPEDIETVVLRQPQTAGFLLSNVKKRSTKSRP